MIPKTRPIATALSIVVPLSVLVLLALFIANAWLNAGPVIDMRL